MPTTRLLLILLLVLASLYAAGCGGDDKDAGDSGDRSASSSEQPSDDDDSGDLDVAPDLEPGDGEDRASGIGSSAFTLTPEIARCMEQAGFTQDAPPTGGLVAWRHANGGRIVVASSEAESVTGGIAAEIGTQYESEVSGDVVVAAPHEQAEPAVDGCLD